jgi:hypothetical protein
VQSRDIAADFAVVFERQDLPAENLLDEVRYLHADEQTGLISPLISKWPPLHCSEYRRGPPPPQPRSHELAESVLATTG